MAMLAESRQRKRYNLVPKGKALFEDSDRFGTKMLEKMGWSKGKGLGKNENGQQEFVRVRYKNDPNGLGFEDRDDQWTEHEKHFNGLLENLNGADSTSNPTTDDGAVDVPAVGFGFKPNGSTKEKLKDKISGQSLEEKSKNSKARVHYKKFTKGKDMSQYSEKDLANIFGKKPTPDDTNIYSQFQAFNVGAGDERREAIKPTQLIETGLSLTDYFKTKMAALKEKKGELMTNGVDNREEIGSSVESEVSVKKKKNKKRSAEVTIEEFTPAPEEAIDEVPRKKKKSKRQVLSCEETETVLPSSVEDIKPGHPLKKKSKKQSVEDELNGSVIQEETSLKKKKRKNMTVDAIDPKVEEDLKKSGVDDNPPNTVAVDPSPKKKKSKQHLVAEQVEIKSVSLESNADEVPSKKKRTAEEGLLNEGGDSSTIIPIKTKKSKKGTPENPKEDSSSTKETKSEKPPKKNSNRSTIESEIESEAVQTNDTLLTVNPNTEQKPKKNKKKNKSKHNSAASTPLIEKFRNIELHQFEASNISQIIGYGFSEDIKLNIKNIKRDQERIMMLWSGTLDKYHFKTPRHKIYNAYRTKVKQARKMKSGIPRIKVKCLKRKHVFQCL